jgi:uncharacterized protein YqhQ
MKKKSNKLNWKNHPYGGQAVMDGVMIKSKNFISVSVRNEKGKIVNETTKFNDFLTRYKFWRLPFFRGIANMVEMLVVGMSALTKSVNLHIEEEEETLSPLNIFLTMLISVGLALILFKLLPLGVASFSKNFFGFESGFVFNLIDAIMKVLILIGYILLISLMPDIKNLFMYHGAEHKSVHAWEHYKNFKQLTVKNTQKFKTLHPRCGTSFLLFVVFASLIVYMLIPITFSFWMNYLFRILLLPFIIGLSYEFLKFSSKYEKSFIMKLLILPGLLMQKITTSEPTNKQVEVALNSLKQAIKTQKKFESKS